MPPIIIAAGIAATAAIGGAVISANATKGAGEATLTAADKQVAMAQKALDEQIKAREQGVALGHEVGSMSAGELSSINQLLRDKESALNASMFELDKQKSILQSVDPAVRTAGQQTLDLLNGKLTPYLSPILKQRELDRTKLENTLASQFGPGYKASSAGIEALTKFDAATSQVVSQGQQQALTQVSGIYSSLFGAQQAGQSDITKNTGDIYARSTLTDSNVLQAEQFIRNREANAVMSGFTGQPVNYSGPVAAQNSVVSSSGLPFAGTQAIGNTVTQLGGAGLGVASQIYGQQQGAQNTLDLINSLKNGGGSAAYGAGFQTFGAMQPSTYTPSGAGFPMNFSTGTVG